jgi:large subunit ribosomal protein L13
MIYKGCCDFFCLKTFFLCERNLHLCPLEKKRYNYSCTKIINVDTLSYKTKSVSKEEADRKWYIIDGEGEVVGRLASRIATVLRGKHKPSFTPHADTGDYVIIINAEKVRFTGNKLDQKEYITYSGYPGGQRRRTAKVMMEKKPIAIMEKAVRGMLPKTKLGRAMIKKLFVYEGADHPHTAQKPEPFKF